MPTMSARSAARERTATALRTVIGALAGDQAYGSTSSTLTDWLAAAPLAVAASAKREVASEW